MPAAVGSSGPGRREKPRKKDEKARKKPARRCLRAFLMILSINDLFVAATEEMQHEHEHVDEVEIEAEGPHQALSDPSHRNCPAHSTFP